MSEVRERRGNRSNRSRRRETNIPPEHVIREIIEKGDPEKLVEEAKKIGGGLARNEELKAHQIRAFFSEVKRMEAAFHQKRELSDDDRRRLVLLKPKLAYQAKRQAQSGKGYGVVKLEQALRPAIESIGSDVKRFQNFVDFFEAILAYHKYADGKE